MSSPSPYLSREEQAMREIGRTTIRPSVAWMLVIVFLAAIASVALVQQIHCMRGRLALQEDAGRLDRKESSGKTSDREAIARPSGSLLARLFAFNRGLLRDIHIFEDALEDNSVVGQMIRPPVQYLLAWWLGAGNEKAYCGVRPWLFYRPDIDYLVGPGFLEVAQLAMRAAAGNEWERTPQPDPRPAIIDFNEQLACRGIQLVVVPVPPKPAIQPDKFSRRFKPGAAPLENASYDGLLRDLERSRVLVADLTPLFNPAQPEPADAAPGMAPEQFLATDTHWRPETVARVARYLAQYIERHVQLPPCPGVEYRVQFESVTNRGDLAVMLRLPDCSRGYQPESVTLRRILTGQGAPWRPDESSDILVLGDSFSNIYSLEPMGWGESAGLIEQLSFELRRPLDCLVINDNGAYATRALLARELARGRDRLAGKRLVIWQFAMRELTGGDWRPADLALGKPAPAQFFVPSPGSSVVVRGTLRAIASAPRPGTVPYKDHIVAAYIDDLESGAPDLRGGQALVYLESMRDNIRKPAAGLRHGALLTVRLRRWSDVAGLYERINRTELPDEELQLVEPCWGELIEVGR